VKEFVRANFRLTDETILVTELACQVPGCPPLETVIAFWGKDEKRRHYKVFKPVAEVVMEDLPPWWMRDALIETEVFGCPCC
jgi:nitrate reductase delta subunit